MSSSSQVFLNNLQADPKETKPSALSNTIFDSAEKHCGSNILLRHALSVNKSDHRQPSKGMTES
jgi:hypothetical protein